MIECLSSPNWLNPQIDCLLFLQNIRLGHSELIDKLFLSITILGEFWLPTLISAIVYWCIDFKSGMYLFTLEGFNALFAHFFKMLACVYRPWVLSDRIQPSKLAVTFAKGYSFPSGHSAMSSSVIGGLAFLLRKNKIVCSILICLILLVGFSRLWLGVHTPQDVIGGFTIGIILIFALNLLIEKAEKNNNIYLYLIGIVNILAAAALIYICYFNSYRMDYVSGELLVNPAKSIYVTCVVYGYILGLLNGCFICGRFLRFNPNKSTIKSRVIRGIIGGIGVILLLKFVLQNVFLNVYDTKISVLISFLSGITITLFYPVAFTFVEKCLNKKSD